MATKRATTKTVTPKSPDVLIRVAFKYDDLTNLIDFLEEAGYNDPTFYRLKMRQREFEQKHLAG